MPSHNFPPRSTTVHRTVPRVVIDIAAGELRQHRVGRGSDRRAAPPPGRSCDGPPAGAGDGIRPTARTSGVNRRKPGWSVRNEFAAPAAAAASTGRRRRSTSGAPGLDLEIVPPGRHSGRHKAAALGDRHVRAAAAPAGACPASALVSGIDREPGQHARPIFGEGGRWFVLANAPTPLADVEVEGGGEADHPAGVVKVGAAAVADVHQAVAIGHAGRVAGHRCGR